MAAKNVEYDVIAHEPPSSSVQTAKACCIPGDWLAKAVLLRPTTKREADVVAFQHPGRLDHGRDTLGRETGRPLAAGTLLISL
jgi:hypothetical protein